MNRFEEETLMLELQRLLSGKLAAAEIEIERLHEVGDRRLRERQTARGLLSAALDELVNPDPRREARAELAKAIMDFLEV